MIVKTSKMQAEIPTNIPSIGVVLIEYLIRRVLAEYEEFLKTKL